MSNYVSNSKAQIKPEAFHLTIDGSQVDLYTLKNSNGLEANITNYGGIVVSLTVPDKSGKLGDVVLGYDTLNDYIGNTPYFGALIGRYGNAFPACGPRPAATRAFEDHFRAAAGMATLVTLFSSFVQRGWENGDHKSGHG